MVHDTMRSFIPMPPSEEMVEVHSYWLDVAANTTKMLIFAGTHVLATNENLCKLVNLIVG